MWTKQKDVIKFSNEYLKDITICEIKEFAETAKMKLGKWQIVEWLNKIAKADGVDMIGDREALATRTLAELDENMLRRISSEIVAAEERKKYQFNEKDYDMFDRALRIYKEKCLKLCTVLELIQSKQISYGLIERFDLSMEEGNILTSDLVRILKPLKKNYELLFSLDLRANDYATYLNKINTPITGKVRMSMPTGSLINYSLKYSDEKVEMTEKQKIEWMKKHEKIMRNALGISDQY